MTVTDDARISLLRQDPEKGMASALDAYLPLVRFIIAGRLGADGTDEDVADLTQETFLALWQKRGELDPRRGSVKAFLVAVAKNKTADRLRAAQRPGQTASIEAVDPASDFSLEEALIDRETKARLISAVAALGSPDREIVVYRCFYGFSAAKTGEALGLTEGSVNTRLSRAKQKLRKILEEDA